MSEKDRKSDPRPHTPWLGIKEAQQIVARYIPREWDLAAELLAGAAGGS
jgi:hypothetical protein